MLLSCPYKQDKSIFFKHGKQKSEKLMHQRKKQKIFSTLSKELTDITFIWTIMYNFLICLKN